LTSWGKTSITLAPTGAGQALKLVNNLIYNLNRLSMCEGLVLGAKAGIDPETMRQAISVSTGASYVINNVTPNILRGDFAGRESSLNLACKTLKLITDFADELQVPLLLGQLGQADLQCRPRPGTRRRQPCLGGYFLRRKRRHPGKSPKKQHRPEEPRAAGQAGDWPNG